jgi:hypothetical protein
MVMCARDRMYFNEQSEEKKFEETVWRVKKPFEVNYELANKIGEAFEKNLDKRKYQEKNYPDL